MANKDFGYFCTLAKITAKYVFLSSSCSAVLTITIFVIIDFKLDNPIHAMEQSTAVFSLSSFIRSTDHFSAPGNFKIYKPALKYQTKDNLLLKQ